MNGSDIAQFVMSCRVMGLEMELAAIATLEEAMHGPVAAACRITDANAPCRDPYARRGFVETPRGRAKPAELVMHCPVRVADITLMGAEVTA